MSLHSLCLQKTIKTLNLVGSQDRKKSYKLKILNYGLLWHDTILFHRYVPMYKWGLLHLPNYIASHANTSYLIFAAVRTPNFTQCSPWYSPSSCSLSICTSTKQQRHGEVEYKTSHILDHSSRYWKHHEVSIGFTQSEESLVFVTRG
jgi:hypothetical protein